MSLYLTQEQFDELLVRLTLEAKRQSDLQFKEQEKMIKNHWDNANKQTEALKRAEAWLKTTHPKIYETYRDKVKV